MEITYGQDQFFLIITLILWLFFISEYILNRNTSNGKMLSIVQLFFSIPFDLAISLISFNYAYGFIIVFLVPILSVYLFYDGSMKKRGK